VNEHTDGSEGGSETAKPVDETAEGTSEERERPEEPSGRSAWGALSELQEAVGGLVDSALKSVAPATGRFPRYDLIEVPDERYLLLFDLPGLEKADVDVTARGGEVAVEGTRARPTVPEGAEVLRSERMYGRFRRSVRVPGDVDLAGVSAKMTNGVLEIRLPKRSSESAQHVTVE
jgi:HSP20 family protein